MPFVLFFEGLARASSTAAAFIHKTLVIWVALLAVPLLGERLSWAHWAAIALLLAGQAVLVGDAGTVTLGAGELMIFGATLLWSVEVVVVKRLLASLAAPTLAAARLGIGLPCCSARRALGKLEQALGLRRRAVGLGAAHRRDPDRLRGHVVRGARPCAGGGRHGRARAGAIVTALLNAGYAGASLDVLGLGLIAAGGVPIALRALGRPPCRHERRRAALRALCLSAERARLLRRRREPDAARVRRGRRLRRRARPARPGFEGAWPYRS